MTAGVFGSLPFSNQSGDQLISKVVSAAIAALFKRTGKLTATVRAEPVAKLLQGSIDGFDFIGQSMLMYNGLRIEAMELYVQAVAIDFSAIFTGQVKLRQPTRATLRVVLTEEDLTTSFNTPFILTLKSLIKLGEEEPILLEMTTAVVVEERRKIQFVEVVYQGDERSKALGEALISHVNNLMDLDKFALDGTQLRVDRLRLKDKQIIFYGIADIERFPQRK
ncbi:MAG: DUF2993 domain-containing protein [Microcystis aeruginosa Ma_AC_P_19900807_S299]|nr:MAG: DUF2993 domain-containing protein [Microcystis aeruginosa Ma_AC_P_19900807_S299]